MRLHSGSRDEPAGRRRFYVNGDLKRASLRRRGRGQRCREAERIPPPVYRTPTFSFVDYTNTVSNVSLISQARNVLARSAIPHSWPNPEEESS